MKKQDYCDGCKDNFYNNNNPYGVKKCWRLKEHKVEWLWKVSIWTYGLQKRVKGLSCWSSKAWVMCREKYYQPKPDEHLESAFEERYENQQFANDEE